MREGVDLLLVRGLAQMNEVGSTQRRIAPEFSRRETGLSPESSRECRSARITEAVTNFSDL
jgi:hypothetical protein